MSSPFLSLGEPFPLVLSELQFFHILHGPSHSAYNDAFHFVAPAGFESTSDVIIVLKLSGNRSDRLVLLTALCSLLRFKGATSSLPMTP